MAGERQGNFGALQALPPVLGGSGIGGGGHSEPPGSSLDSPMEISGVCSWHFSQGCRSKQFLFAELNWNVIGT